MRKYTKFKVCVVSAYKDPTLLAKATELGADDFLSKPIDKPSLFLKIRDLLRPQNIALSNDTFPKVNFLASLLNSPLLLNFNIVGITPERVLIESIFNFKDDSDIAFSCKQLCEAINYEKEFNMKVAKTTSIRNKFIISADLIRITLSQSHNLKI